MSADLGFADAESILRQVADGGAAETALAPLEDGVASAQRHSRPRARGAPRARSAGSGDGDHAEDESGMEETAALGREQLFRSELITRYKAAGLHKQKAYQREKAKLWQEVVTGLKTW